ncbi:MAG: hypothetical protein J7604_25175 [Sporocytophaga sp.]|uniref:hypothetical protein n=1 Tax=Sporocytophaga sp. TaxID=2231183 RepID=UPI001B15D578|nr:hypothetical protein [Sporocytophaga sp.]MBO9703525.1 hypothetical protein [Sporocytophaga sp.]
MKRKLLNLLIAVLFGYSLYFLYLLVKLLITLYENRDRVQFNMSIAKQLVIELVMIVLTASFGYIIFRIRQNIKK